MCKHDGMAQQKVQAPYPDQAQLLCEFSPVGVATAVACSSQVGDHLVRTQVSFCLLVWDLA